MEALSVVDIALKSEHCILCRIAQFFGYVGGYVAVGRIGSERLSEQGQIIHASLEVCTVPVGVVTVGVIEVVVG